MSGEIGYTVDLRDVFHETIAPFLLGHSAVRESFMRHYADLLDVVFWQGHKERIPEAHMHDIFPCEQDKRFGRPAPSNDTQAAPNLPA